MIKKVLFLNAVVYILLLLTGCASSGSHVNTWPTAPIDLSANNTAFWKANTATIWNQLQHTSQKTLQSTLAQTTVAYNQAWLNLAIISKRDSNKTSLLIDELITWRQAHPDHPGNSLFPHDDELIKLRNTPPPTHIALLLPLKGAYGDQGKVIRDGFLNAYYASPIRNQYSQTISFYDTSESFNIRDSYDQAIAKGADLVVGPLTKEDVAELVKHANSHVTTLALNYTDHHLPSHFYEFGLSAMDEAEQAANKAHGTGVQRAIVIAPLTASGQKTASSLISRWTSLGGKVTDTYYFADHANFSEDVPRLMHVNPTTDREQMHTDNQKAVLEQQRRQDFDVVFLIAPPEQARVIVPLLKYYYAGDVPIYATSAIYSSVPSPQKDIDLNGVHFLDIPFLLRNQSTRPSKAPSHYNRLYAVGLDAYLLSIDVPRLVAMPNFPFYAATGALTLTSDQHIYRRLPWTEMHAGHP